MIVSDQFYVLIKTFKHACDKELNIPGIYQYTQTAQKIQNVK